MALASLIISLTTIPITAAAVWWAWRAGQLARRLRPDFPTAADLEAQGGPWATCVCGNTITPWPYPGQGEGTVSGGMWWWVHLGSCRRSHTRDRTSAYFHETPFAHPEDEVL